MHKDRYLNENILGPQAKVSAYAAKQVAYERAQQQAYLGETPAPAPETMIETANNRLAAALQRVADLERRVEVFCDRLTTGSAPALTGTANEQRAVPCGSLSQTLHGLETLNELLGNLQGQVNRLDAIG